MRTHERIIEQGKESLKQKKVILGVKGISVLCTLPLIDISKCFIPEIMHSVFLGCVKMFLIEWFISNEKWNFKKNIAEIDNLIAHMKIPANVIRRPLGKLSECKKFKASQLHDWLVIYSLPILKKFMSKEYFDHWVLFVTAAHILLQKNIPRRDLQKADLLLKDFVHKTEFYAMLKLYGSRTLKIM